MKTKLTILALSVSIASALAQQEGNNALAALQAIPGEYQDTVVKLSCTAAAPNPAQWHALAYDGEVGDAPRNIVISAGEVISNSLSAKIGTMLAHQTSITLGNVLVDSPTVYEVASELCQARGVAMSSADMTLTQPGEGAAPVWEVTCRDSSGKKVAILSISAENGETLAEKF